MTSSATTPVLQQPVTLETVSLLSGNLFQVAAQYLGDAIQWNRIARLNGLTDPFFTGYMVLKIPPVNSSAGNGGVLYA